MRSAALPLYHTNGAAAICLSTEVGQKYLIDKGYSLKARHQAWSLGGSHIKHRYVTAAV